MKLIESRAEVVVSTLLNERVSRDGYDDADDSQWNDLVDYAVNWLKEQPEVLERIKALPENVRVGALAMVMMDPDVAEGLGATTKDFQTRFQNLPPDTVIGLAQAVREVMNSW